MTREGKGLIWGQRASLALAVVVLACAPDPVGVQPTASASARLNAAGAPWSGASLIQEASPGAGPNFNTHYLDGCPTESRDGKTFFMATNRPDSYGVSHGIDIYVSHRESTDAPWSDPVRVPEPINSEYNDFCPMPARDGHEFFFASNRPGGCGGDDIYVTRFRDDGGIEEPRNLGCDVNSAGNEAGPVPVNEPGRGKVLYFSSTRAGGFTPEPDGATTGDADLYSSEWREGRYRPRTLVPGVNSASDDMQPYVQRDARELYFSSARPGGMGGPDIWVATRASAHDAWSEPVNLGPAINSGAGESRPSLSWDGSRLYFGSTRSTAGPGQTPTTDSNIYVSFRGHAPEPRS
jgi:hypothetical protein